MPLDAEQQKQLDTLNTLADTFVEEIGKYEDHIRRADAIKKFDTRGQPLDLSKLSMQDLQDMFDVGRNLSATNEVDTLLNEKGAAAGLDYHYGSDYLVGHNITSARGPESIDADPDTEQEEVIVPATREYMEAAVGQWMQSVNHAANPRELLQAEMTVRDSPAGNLGNRRNALTEKYEALQKSVKEATGEELHDPRIENSIKTLKASEKAYDDQAKAFKADVAKRAPIVGVEFAAQMGFDARQAAFEVLEVSDMDKATKANLSGAKINGLDLSRSDLTNVQIDADTLARANGLEGVRGVDPKLLAEAQAIKPHVERLDDLNERMAKLENKGGVLANLKNLRHGGVEGERKHLQKEIEKAQEAMTQARAGVAAQFPAVENEFEQKNVYQVGADVNRRAEAPKDPRMEAMQASVTFRLDSDSAMNDQGSKVAFAKTQIGTKSGDLRAAGRSEKDIGDAQNQEFNAFGNVAALHGTMTAVNQADFTNTEAMKAAVGSDITTLLTRSVATSAVDKALGMNAMAEEKIGIDEQGRHIGISVGVPGAPILKRPDTLEANETCLNIKYDDPNVQKGLYDLQAQDYITGQIDRHTGNIFVDPHSGQVSGIDNDLAFPTIDREKMITESNLSAKVIAGKPQFMHEDTADKIEALKPETLRATLESIELPEGVAPLEPAAIDGAVQRLQELQAEIKEMRKDGRVVQKFDDNTYQKALERQQAINPDQPLGTGGTVIKTSYLAAAVIEQKKSIGMGQGRDLATKDDIPKAQVDAKFAAYQKGVQDARADIAASPGRLQDTGLAKTITDGQAKLLKLQEDLQTHDENLNASAARLTKARQDGNAEVVAGLEEIFDNAQQARQQTLQELKTEQQKVSAALDRAVEPLKPRIAAQARLATNQQQVAQPQNQVNAGEVKVEANANDQKLEASGEIKLEASGEVKLAASGEIKLEDSGDVKLEASNDIPLTQSQIDAIENEFGDIDQDLGEIDLDASGELLVEGEEPGIEMNEVPGEEQGIEAEGNNQQQGQPAVEAPAPANEAAQDQDLGQGGPAKKTSKFASVRDSIKNLAGTAKSAVAQKLESKGAEQPLHEVPSNKQAEYKRFQQQLNELKGGGDAIKAAGLLGPDTKAHKDFKKGDAEGGLTAPEIKEKMDALKKEFPGLKQLDRSKVGQVVHSGVRDAAKSAGAKLKG